MDLFPTHFVSGRRVLYVYRCTTDTGGTRMNCHCLCTVICFARTFCRLPTRVRSATQRPRPPQGQAGPVSLSQVGPGPARGVDNWSAWLQYRRGRLEAPGVPSSNFQIGAVGRRRTWLACMSERGDGVAPTMFKRRRLLALCLEPKSGPAMSDPTALQATRSRARSKACARRAGPRHDRQSGQLGLRSRASARSRRRAACIV